jgi:hypothetical protein
VTEKSQIVHGKSNFWGGNIDDRQGKSPRPLADEPARAQGDEKTTA